MTNVLAEIVEHKRGEVAGAQRARPVDDVLAAYRASC